MTITEGIGDKKGLKTITTGIGDKKGLKNHNDRDCTIRKDLYSRFSFFFESSFPSFRLYFYKTL